MDDMYKLMLILVAMAALAGTIGIIGVLGDRRDRWQTRAKHQAMAREAAVLGWEYQSGPGAAFQLAGAVAMESAGN